MFEATTRFILFAVGLSLTLATVVVGRIGPVVFSAARTSIMLLLIWSLIVWLVERRRYPRDNRFVWLVVFAVALVVSLVTSFLSGSPLVTTALDGIQLGAAIAFAPLLAYVISNRRRLDALLTGFLVSVAITATSVIRGGAAGLGRTGGIGGDPNHFAIEALIALTVAVLFLYTKPSIVWRTCLSVLVVLFLAGILRSMSRTAFIVLPIVFGMWMLRFRRFDLLRFVLPVAVVVVIAVSLVPSGVKERMGARMGAVTSREGIEGDESIMSRLVAGEYSFRAFASNPILGVGYRRWSTWAVEHRRYLRHADPQAGQGAGLIFEGQAIHNAYLHVMAEMGLLGLIPFLAILILSWNQYNRAWRLARGVRGDPELTRLGLYALFLQLGYLGMLIASLALPSVYWKSLWLLLGLCLVVLELTTRRFVEVRDSGGGEASAPEREAGIAVPAFDLPGPLDPRPDLR